MLFKDLTDENKVADIIVKNDYNDHLLELSVHVDDNIVYLRSMHGCALLPWKSTPDKDLTVIELLKKQSFIVNIEWREDGVKRSYTIPH